VADDTVGAAADGVDLTTWPPPGATPLPVDDLYERLADRGLAYGPAFRGLRAAWQHGDDIYADVALDAPEQANGFGLHPALLDAALHALGAGKLLPDTDRPLLPFAWSDVRLFAADATTLRVRLTLVGTDGIALLACDITGEPVARAGTLALRPLSSEQLRADGSADATNSLFRVDWTAVETPVRPGTSPRLAVIGTGLPSSGRPDWSTWPGLAELLAAVDAGGEVPDVVVAPFVPAVPSATEGVPVPPLAPSAEAARSATEAALELLQTWLTEPRFATARLALVTRQAVAVTASDDVRDLVHAPLWGLVRSAQSENPDRFVLIDIDTEPASLAALPEALTTKEPELVVRGGTVHAARLTGAATGDDALELPEGERGWRIEAGEGGTLEELHVRPTAEAGRPLAAGEVRVGIRAAGVNFRDVLISLGMYPDKNALLGSEAAGVVLETGHDVPGLQPGDRVMGLFTGAFGPVAVSDWRMLTKVPDDWSFTRAAGTPIVFLTALYALSDLGGVGVGDRVLVHAAAGGVGMAAVQLARHLGAEVWATASKAKWETVRALGVAADHLASSRDTGFGRQFTGVDVVLNSLVGELVDTSLDLLGPGGRFVEMGKADVRDADDLAARGITYRAFDLAEAGPDRIQQMLQEIVELFGTGALAPLPVRVWDVRRAGEAFRFMSLGRHVGKNVLSVSSPGWRRDGTVLVTGGTGVLGRLIARHLVTEHGVRSLLLVSRSGEQAEDAEELRGELAGLGAQVQFAACDVADRGALAGVLDTVPAHLPLTAVVHTAGVLDDATVESLSAEQVERVFRAKADGAAHLHELTRDLDLDAFILFSSAAGTFGGPGQANYAAASVFLDALAHHRRAAGLPALSLAWSLWAERSGMTGHLDDADLRRMAKGGVVPLTSRRGLALFDAARRTSQPTLVLADLDQEALRTQAASGVVPALLRGLVKPPAVPRRAAATTGDGGPSLIDRLARLPLAEQTRTLLGLVRTNAAAVLGRAGAGTVGAGRAFKELGFDSLTAVELRNRLNAATGLRLPATLVFDYPTPSALAEYLRDELLPRAAAGTDHTSGGTTDGSGDSPDETEFRRLIADIPMSRFAAAGLVEAVLQLAGGTVGDGARGTDEQLPHGPIPSDPSDLSTLSNLSDEDPELIDVMDVASLVRRALGAPEA
ncbi:SDR family NAD(P)-dependent oxidoreductase, partial [Streptomyces sp. NPDC007851]|uniref:SDR family NAD(P)-dependent oxidoreductase n=1 Tax=Streptomyces sp. NPDC007851 TaxID=3155008 RepID=UPI0034012AF3